MATALLFPLPSHDVNPGPPRVPEAAVLVLLAGRGCEELLLSIIRHGLLLLFSLLTSSSAVLGSGMGWLIPSSSSWACCLLRATWKQRAAGHRPAHYKHHLCSLPETTEAPRTPDVRIHQLQDKV